MSVYRVLKYCGITGITIGLSFAIGGVVYHQSTPSKPEHRDAARVFELTRRLERNYLLLPSGMMVKDLIKPQARADLGDTLEALSAERDSLYNLPEVREGLQAHEQRVQSGEFVRDYIGLPACILGMVSLIAAGIGSRSEDPRRRGVTGRGAPVLRVKEEKNG